MKVFTFTEAGGDKGFGHVARCYALMQAFKERGAEVVMFVDGSMDGAEDLCSGEFTQGSWLTNAEEFAKDITPDDILVIDSYCASEDVYRLFSAKTDKRLFFDDFERINYPEGEIINPSADGTDGFYGLEHVILRKAYWSLPKKEINEDIRKIFVSLGGSGEVERVTQICLALGEAFGDVEIAVLSKGIDGGYYGLDDSETAELMQSCDIAVTAGGQTMLELAACGVPAVIVKLADNQNTNIKRFIDEEIGVYADDRLPEVIAQKTKSLKSPSVRRRISEKLQMIIDGQGARRVSEKMVSG